MFDVCRRYVSSRRYTFWWSTVPYFYCHVPRSQRSTLTFVENGLSVSSQSLMTAGGAAPPVQAFLSGGVYHTACVLSQIVHCCEQLPDVSRQCADLHAVMDHLTAKRHMHPQTHSRSDITQILPAVGVQQGQFQVHKWLKEGDPLSSEQVMVLLDQEVDSVRTSADLQLPRSVAGCTLWS